MSDLTVKQKGEAKFARLPQSIKILAEKPENVVKNKPKIRIINNPKVAELKQTLRDHNLFTVCEEASCPNLNECFGKGTATFMIMGDKCTRRCTFCDVGHGRPDSLDVNEPKNTAKVIKALDLKYVVITSVDRDDLKDGGASHFAECIKEIRDLLPSVKVEILVPDFRGRMEIALDNLSFNLPDVFNHNVETVERLYKAVRPGSDYLWSHKLIKEFKARNPNIPTKSGLMLGLGEKTDEVKQTIQDLKDHDCDMLTLGQYLQPSIHHAAVHRYVSMEEFAELKEFALNIGFKQVASGPLVRSSYHADNQAEKILS